MASLRRWCLLAVVPLLLGACGPADVAEIRDATTGPASGDARTDARSDAVVPADASTEDGPRDAASPDVGMLRVLFVGNSYTYVNDLPTVVASLSRAHPEGPRIETDSVTVGAATFQTHWTNGAVMQRLANGTRWDALVLQGQSLEAVGPPPTFVDYGTRLARAGQDVGASVILFETWARGAGDPAYDETWSGGTPAALERRIRTGYETLAAAANARVAYAGWAWLRATESSPAPVLHQDDKSHPTVAGTYLTALVIYRALTGAAITTAPGTPSGIDDVTATRLRALGSSEPRDGGP